MDPSHPPQPPTQGSAPTATTGGRGAPTAAETLPAAAPLSQAEVPSCIRRRYRYVRDIGEGGMGRVVLVEDVERDGRVCALKWVPSSAVHAALQARHRREFQILSRFEHPHILRVFDFGRVEGTGQYFTCEYLGGPALNTAVEHLSDRAVIEIVVQLLRALGYLHTLSWVHGDLKLENVLLREPAESKLPHACLLDFGLAHPEGRPPEEKILGTIYYMPPERILGARMDRRGDLYSFGVLAYRLFTGKLPFSGKNKGQVLEGHIRHAPPRPGSLRPSLPHEIDELLISLLAKKPAERPQCTDDVLRVLNDVYGHPEVPETTETLKAYVRNSDCTGWEDSQHQVLARVGQRILPSESAANLSFRSVDSYEETVSSIHPVEPHLGGAADAGMVLVRSASGIDLARFRDALERRVEILGVHPVNLDPGPAGTPIAGLIRGVLGILPAPRLRDDPGFRELCLLLPNPGATNEALIDRLLEWLAVVAERFPFVVFMNGPEDWGEPFFQLLTRSAQRENRLVGLKRIAWVGFQSKRAGPYLARWLTDPEAERWCHERVLEPLDPEALTRWLKERFVDWTPPENLRKLLEEESEGNPGLLEKIVCSMIDEGVLRRGWDGWEFVPLRESHHLSPLVRWARTAFESLSPELKRVLHSLVVLGGSGDAEWIQRAAVGLHSELIGSLIELQNNGWIAGELEGKRYRFRYFYQLKAVRDTVPPPAYRAANYRVARWLQEREAQGKEIDSGRLAGHLLEAGDATAALAYARRAVRSAIADGRVLSGIRILERFLEQDQEPNAERLPLLVQLGDLRQAWGPPSEIIRLRRQALEIEVAGKGDRELVALLATKLAESEGLAGNIEEARRLLNAALPVLRNANHPEGCRRALLVAAELILAEAQFDTLDGVFRSLAALPPTKRPELLGWETFLRVASFEVRGQERPALETSDAGLRALDDVSHRLALAWVATLLAQRLRLRTRWLAAIRQFRLAAYLFRQCRDSLQQGRALLSIGDLYVRMGYLREGGDHLARAESLMERLGSGLHDARLRTCRGLLLIRNGWFKDAERNFKKVLEWGKRRPSTCWPWEVLLARAEVDVRAGRVDQAYEALEGPAHPSRAPHGADPAPWVRWGVLRQRLALKQGDARTAIEQLQVALCEVRERGRRFHEIPLLIHHVEVLETLGCVEAARRLEDELDQFVRHHPEYGFQWALSKGIVAERQLLDADHAEELAMYYRRRGMEALDAKDWNRGVFLLEEAQHHSRRVRAQPIEALVTARLASVYEIAGRRQSDPEVLVRQAWQRLERCGVVLGRIEVLTLWATIRVQRNDPEGAESKLQHAHALLEDWSQPLIPYDSEALAAAHGLTLAPGTPGAPPADAP